MASARWFVMTRATCSVKIGKHVLITGGFWCSQEAYFQGYTGLKETVLCQLKETRVTVAVHPSHVAPIVSLTPTAFL